MLPQNRIARRCINCGTSETDANPLHSRRHEGLIVYVCKDVNACARRYVAQDLGSSDAWKLEFLPGF